MSRILLITAGLMCLLLAGCDGGEDSANAGVFVATLPPQGRTMVPTPTVTLTMTPIPATATTAPSATPAPPTATSAPTDTPAPTPTPEPERTERFALRRPIRVSDTTTQRDYVDRTYPYGDTQDGAREVHSGVEFFNPQGTTVLAAGPGTVVYAGDDSETLIGPRNNYYGNVVIVRHDDLRSALGEPVYTLYGHLDRVLVVEEGIITPGMPIGEVGATGIAIGPHLHFEVRVGDDPLDFDATQNPDLWIVPYPGAGIIAGRIVDANGEPVPGVTVNVRSARTGNELYAFTYGGEPANPDPVWLENFTRGDLPAGDYTVSVVHNGTVQFNQRIAVNDQALTWLDVVVE